MDRVDGKTKSNHNVSCIDDITFVVRSVGERTEQICVDRLVKLGGQEQVELIRDITPFCAAVEKAFELGIKKGRKWTACIDADMLYWDERIERFVSSANRIVDEKGESNCFSFQGFCYDHFFCRPRIGGFHLYLTRNLPNALQYCGNDSLRPETIVKRSMAAQGCYTYVIHEIVGIHDFFQYYESIVKKGILHSKKHSSIEELITKWTNMQSENEDYKWALRGVKIGRDFSEKILVDDIFMKRLIENSGLTFPKQPVLLENEVERMLDLLNDETIYELQFGEMIQGVKPLQFGKILTAISNKIHFGDI